MLTNFPLGLSLENIAIKSYFFIYFQKIRFFLVKQNQCYTEHKNLNYQYGCI